ncbi:MAG: N-acetyl-gamma-glutamyl-phosphate reductase [Thermoguttaceae bacterium]|nr:N-acetyl-gamma-glutamyl-phosphate reductase [Thermoguttaceae bacterium]
MEKIKIAVLGSTGYTALELLKLLRRHPGAEVVAVTSRENTSRIDEVHPSLCGEYSICCENLAPKDLAARGVQVVFSCLPHTATAAVAPELIDLGMKVIDFGADYRLNDAAVFNKWYNVTHPDPDRLPKTPYGLPELFREAIKVSSLVANPGCYPTSAILPLAPLLKGDFIAPDDIIIDSKSGVSGAGRKPSLKNLYPECNEAISAYGVGTHRHTPEIEEVLTTASGKPAAIIFTPHLTPMDRGILTTTYSKPVKEATQEELLAYLREFYAGEPFVRVVDALPSTKDVIHTNRCHMTVRVVRGRVMTISAIDNLVKGAAGAAVQNFNLICGFEETTALI